MEAKYQLSGAVRDANSFKAASEGLGGKSDREVVPQELANVVDLKSNLPARIRDVVQRAGPEDTVVKFAAGHGSQGRDGKFHLMSTQGQSGR